MTNTINDVIEALQSFIDKQSDDEGLWFHAETATEDYLNRGLRDLHSRVEGSLECLRDMTEGMVLVPKEPTEAMMKAARYENDCFSSDPEGLNLSIYKAMLQATEGSNDNG